MFEKVNNEIKINVVPYLRKQHDLDHFRKNSDKLYGFGDKLYQPFLKE